MNEELNSGGSQSANVNPYAAPTSDSIVTDSPRKLELAELWRRLVGALIDSAIIFLAFVCILLVAMLVWPALGKFNHQYPKLVDLISVLVGFVVYIAINGYFLAGDGQSIGKKLVGTKIVRENGAKATLRQIIAMRMLPIIAISVIPFIGGLVATVDVLMIFRKGRQCGHDIIGDTIVVRA